MTFEKLVPISCLLLNLLPQKCYFFVTVRRSEGKCIQSPFNSMNVDKVNNN